MHMIPDASCTAIHCMGNGEVCAYANGLRITQLFGPHYSAPDLCSIDLLAGADGRESRRLPETAVWTHRLYLNGREIAMVTDFAAAARAVFVRAVEGREETVWTLDCIRPRTWHPLAARLLPGATAYWAQILAGTPFYDICSTQDGDAGYVTAEPVYACLLFTGDIRVTQSAPGTLEAAVRTGTMTAVFAKTFAALLEECRRELEMGSARLLEETAAAGRDFTARRRANRPGLDEAGWADDIAFLLRCQQSISGGILAGHHYHLAYIRDNYGAHRGLLSLGCFEEAKRLLLYYAGVFARYGTLHNAQGTDSFAFHIHENDKVEITGYIVLMAAEYAEATGDAEILRTVRPVLLWAAEQQHGTLRRGMLPFNGDETYIAGGLLPRTVLNDASMEATALYHRACERLLEYADALELEADVRAWLAGDRDEIAARFEENFMPDGRLYANRPAFYSEGEEPPVRYGVYQCGHGMGPCACRNPDGVYVCPDCADKTIEGLRANEDTRYSLPSAVLMPAVAGSPFMRTSSARRCVEEMRRSFLENGSLTGRKGRMVGYELGELLLALRFLGMDTPEDTASIAARLMEIRDETGAWVEYYVDGVPTGCMCRPWESGINAAGLTETARQAENRT